MLLTDENTLPEYVFTGKKFLRRKEITEEIRSYIAVRGFLAQQKQPDTFHAIAHRLGLWVD